MERKVRVAAVSYLNTRPLLYGFRDHPVMEQVELSVDYPAKIARQLINDEVDVGLIPVAVIPQLKEYHIISDYCIGAEGPVASVCIFSDAPLEEIENIYLDYQSRSSVELARLLLRDYWKLTPRFIAATRGYEERVKGKDAGVIIGDRALRQRTCNKYIYDLAEAWIAHTGLPFVFAAWISNKPLPEDFIRQFNEATGAGTRGQALDRVIAGTPCDFFDLREYYTQHISYPLTPAKRKGLEKFLSCLQQPAAAER
ncbi:MAG TPA: menaquinone biosynthesis protein [Chitinophagaceae bacterium]